MKKWNSIPCTELNENTFQLIGSDWMLVTAKKEDKANAMTAVTLFFTNGLLLKRSPLVFYFQLYFSRKKI